MSDEANPPPERDGDEACKTVYLVSCVKQKRSGPVAAKDLYQSAWFIKSRSYVEASGHPWFILSAKYGLVAPNTLIDYYEKTLNMMNAVERRQWAALVAKQLRVKVGQTDRFVVLAGARYRQFLMPVLRSMATTVEIPMEGLRFGEQLRWLRRNVKA